MKVFLIILVLHGGQADPWQRVIPYESLANCATAAADIRKNIPPAWKSRDRAIMAFCSDVEPVSRLAL